MLPQTDPRAAETDALSSTSEDDGASPSWDEHDSTPNALRSWSEGLEKKMFGRKRKLGIFFDYDGTLTPIVSDPDKAIISEEMRNIVHKLSLQPQNDVAIVTGRSLPKIRQFMRLDSLCLSGSHGAEVQCPPSEQHPNGLSMSLKDKHLEDLRKCTEHLRPTLEKDFPGTHIEDNKFCHSIHFRRAHFRKEPVKLRRTKLRELRTLVRSEATKRGLRCDDGKMVLEIRPKGKWDKGVAVLWLLRQAFPRKKPATVEKSPWGDDSTSDDNCSGEETDAPPEESGCTSVSPMPVGVPDEETEPFYLYFGDDVSDESAFKALRKTFPERCLTVCVSAKPKATAATHWLKDPSEVFEFIQRMYTAGGRSEAQQELDPESRGTATAPKGILTPSSALLPNPPPTTTSGETVMTPVV